MSKENEEMSLETKLRLYVSEISNDLGIPAPELELDSNDALAGDEELRGLLVTTGCIKLIKRNLENPKQVINHEFGHFMLYEMSVGEIAESLDIEENKLNDAGDEEAACIIAKNLKSKYNNLWNKI